MAQLVRRQIGSFLGAPASWQLASCNANCLQSPKTLHAHKKLPFPMQRYLSANQKELLLCRNTPKNVAKQEKYATLYLISRQKRCFRHPSQNPPAKPPHLPSHSRDFISFWYPACLSAGSAQEYQKDIKSPLETRPPFIVK